MELIRKLFFNKNNGQATLTLPKGIILKTLKIDKLPEEVKVKIQIQKSSKVNMVKTSKKW